MNTLENLLTEIADQAALVAAGGVAHLKGNKSAGVRARQASLRLEKLLKVYRKLSIQRDEE